MVKVMNYSDIYWEDAAAVCGNIPRIEQLAHRTILVTGASGMICSSVVDLLLWLNQKKNYQMRIVLAGRNQHRVEERFQGFQNGKDYCFAAYDATDGNGPELKGICVDYVIHGASNAHPAAYVKEPVETILANVAGLNAVLRMAAEQKAARLLYISSSEVYGKKDEVRPYHEQDYGYLDILGLRASYPSAKRTAETLCIAYGTEYDLDTVIVRPGHIYGPSITENDDRASAQFSRSAANGENIIMKSAGAQLRSYCYTLDCASAILTVLLNGERGNAYNISNPESVCTIREIAEALAGAGGVQLCFENPSDMEKAGYNLMSNSALTSDKLEGLGWKAAFSLQKGVQRTVEILRQK